ncbi:MAG: beta-ketoacyl synthase N-terminal-like domain-containing protein, partial [Deltaproteobacteria bacterium]
MNYLLGAAAVQTAVANVDWTVFKGLYEARKTRLFLERMEAHAQEGASLSIPTKQTDVLQQLEAAPAEDRENLLTGYLQREAARIMRFEPSQLPGVDQGFFEMGMDSLMAMEFKYSIDENLGTSLPLSIAFDLPTIKHLADYIALEVLNWEFSEQTREEIKSEEDDASFEKSKTEPIAIVGLGCRFPGADTPEAFWQSLRCGVDTVSKVPSTRWDADTVCTSVPGISPPISMEGAFLDQVDRFDPRFFGISPREAMHMDPQHRLLLEVSWEALENAGQIHDRLTGSRTGVFVGITTHDYALLLNSGDLSGINAYFSTGNTHNAAAGRLSYILGLQGPSMAVDTACSSSLVAVHLACQSLRMEECRQALAGGVNLMLSPEATIALSKANMLSATGRCKTFDATADGYVRGEGCGVVVLKRLSDAIADGDRIYALIRGSAVNQDGLSSGFTVPNGSAQQELIRRALAGARIEPAEVSCIEAHGTGTSLGDPIEVGALEAVLCQGRSKESPLVIGSVKTNIGHLEAAAGIAGLIKTVLCLQHKEIPPHLHFNQPNPGIAWGRIPVVVPVERMPWPQAKKRIAGVSAFGASGTNAHLIVEEAPETAPSVDAAAQRPAHVLTLSAKTPEALEALAGRYERFLATHPDAELGDVCYTANTGRSHFSHRLAVVAESCEALHARLKAFVSGEVPAGVAIGRSVEAERLKIAFLFTGQGNACAAMGRRLYETQPAFRRTLERCGELAASHLPVALIDVLYPENKNHYSIEDTIYAQPALFALQCALYELWQSWGIAPSAVMGHDAGEYAAAWAAGVFSLEDGLKLVTARARLMQALPAEFEKIARQVTYSPPRLGIVS